MPRPYLGKSAAVRPRGRRTIFTSEHGIGALGLALAVASGSFAAYMISDGSRQPSVNAAQYFSVFAKLTPTGNGANGGNGDADNIATASVRPGEPAGSVRTDALSARGYALRSVTDGTAVIESPEGLREVRRGSILPNVGAVTAIEQRSGQWVVVTSQGLIREVGR